MRKLKRLTLGALLAFLLVSCQSYKKVPYLQDTAFVNDTEPVSYTHLHSLINTIIIDTQCLENNS